MQSKNTEQKVPKLTRSKVKAKVKMTEAHWRVIFEKVGIGMALVDLDGSILEANRSFQEMIGYAAHELRAKNWGEVTHPDDIAVEEARLKEFVEGKEIDHRNGITLDNRRHNLRHCTHVENLRNSQKRIDNTSGYKGVSWHKKRTIWQVGIKNSHKRIHLGYFTCLIRAAKTYDEAAKEYHGEFARLNFPK